MVDTSMHRRAKPLWFGRENNLSGGTTILPPGRRRVPVWVWWMLVFVASCFGVIAYLNQRSSAVDSDVVANDWPATVEPSPEAQPTAAALAIIDTPTDWMLAIDTLAANKPPQPGETITLYQMSDGRYWWQDAGGEWWCTDELSEDGQPMAGTFYLCEAESVALLGIGE